MGRLVVKGALAPRHHKLLDFMKEHPGEAFTGDDSRLKVLFPDVKSDATIGQRLQFLARQSLIRKWREGRTVYFSYSSGMPKDGGDGVKDAADATDRAMAFLKRHYPQAVPIKAEQKVSEWSVDADVGYTRTIIIRVALNALTGEIIRYTRVEG